MASGDSEGKIAEERSVIVCRLFEKIEDFADVKLAGIEVSGQGAEWFPILKVAGNLCATFAGCVGEVAGARLPVNRRPSGNHGPADWLVGFRPDAICLP